MATGSWTSAGAGALAAAGAIWAYGSALAGDTLEVFWCASVASGFALVSLRRRWAIAAGSAVATLGPTYWLSDAVGAGQWASPWIPFSIGVDGAALLVLGDAFGLWRGGVVLRASFGLVALAGARMALADPALTLWLAPSVLTLVGGALLAWRPPADVRGEKKAR